MAREELGGFNLGDERLSRRAHFVTERLARSPGFSLPDAFPTDSELEGTYRLLRNDAVKPEEMLAPHRRQTVARAAAASGTLIAIHDSTEFKFSGEYMREGLALLPNGTQGFLAHTTLVASVSGDARAVHGVVNIETHFAEEENPVSKSERWSAGVEGTEAALGEGKALHVMDKEADAYFLQAQLQTNGARYLIRSNHSRSGMDLEGNFRKMHEGMEERRAVFCRSVRLTARHPAEAKSKSKTGKQPLKGSAYVRTPSGKKAHPSRSEREAHLHVSAGSFIIGKTKQKSASTHVEELLVNIVRVWEPKPPNHCAPVEWLLLTNEPIDTNEQIEALVDAYRARWLIEDFHKALKSGCGFERLQLEGRRSLLNALAIYASIAWRLLRLRSAARAHLYRADEPFLTAAQLAILRFAQPKANLGANPSPQEILAALAKQGGHIKRNGEPGWQVLGRGLQKILEAELGYLAALGAKM